MPSDDIKNAESDRGPATEREDRIRRRAYELWEKSGRPEGSHEAHWYEAAQEIGSEPSSDAAPSGPASKDPAEGSRAVADANLQQAEQDAAPQFVRSHEGSTNDGVSSAEPRIISRDKSGDATFPLKQGRRKRQG